MNNPKIIKLTHMNNNEHKNKTEINYFDIPKNVLYNDLEHLLGITPDEKIINNDKITNNIVPIKTFIRRSDSQSYKKPIQSNNLSKLFDKNKYIQYVIPYHANSTRPIVTKNTIILFINFLKIKKKYGTNIEKKIYENLTTHELIQRLITKRPLAFYSSIDSHLLQNEHFDQGMQFMNIGTDKEQKPYTLKNYMSYDEIMLSSLMSISTPTYFINNGSRHNSGKPTPINEHEISGIYIAQIGARFEKPTLMDGKFCIISREKNTLENGYGIRTNKEYKTISYNEMTKRKYLDIWCNFFNVEYIHTFAEALKIYNNNIITDNKNKKYIPHFLKINNNYLFDTHLYKKRMQVVVDIFLTEASNRARYSKSKKAYCHIIGLGLGVWKIHDIQEQIYLSCFATALENKTYKYISDICFSWFDNAYCSLLFGINSGNFYKSINNNNTNNNTNNNIKIIFSKREPADKLTGENEGKLLVAQYAWDANAYPGNEYWTSSLTGSGDPAAACCSTISELQNPDINIEKISASNMHIAC